VRRIVQECTAIIAKEVESVKSLVNEFAQFARFPTAQLTRENLNRVVADALAVFNGRLDGIRVQERLAVGLPPVLVDAEQFQRVVNLVDNAAAGLARQSCTSPCRLGQGQRGADRRRPAAVYRPNKERLFLPYFPTRVVAPGWAGHRRQHVSDHGTIR
jgi:nitrogen-specific signal transduction histidine kinase